MFFLSPPGAEIDGRSNGVAEMRARQFAKFRPAPEPANPYAALAALTPDQLRDAVTVVRDEARSISPEVMATLAATGRRERGELDPAPPPVKVNADDILRASAKARGLLIELPPAGSPARAILEAGAKRRNEDLGKPL